ncbi:hypothetical protein [Chryseobacterium cucumeris]|nr:hypothetical protein [Chryseobacterium cucumeris]QRA42428.1 hypothetical protein JNG87_17650 [Chryseobacterium cucumeris]
MSNKQWGLIGILVTLNKKTASFETVFFYYGRGHNGLVRLGQVSVQKI